MNTDSFEQEPAPPDSNEPETEQQSRITKLNDALDGAFHAIKGIGPLTPSSRTPGLEIPLAQIVPSKTNPRKSFDGPEFDELVASIEQHGILQPILVRPRELTSADVDAWNANFHTIGQGDCDAEEHGYELICGERRYRAAIKAGLTVIPVAIRSLRDEEVLTIQIVENLQRKDVSALEEAGGYKTLLETMAAQQEGALISERKTREEMVAQIAQEIGKSSRYVWARMKLDQLSPELKEVLAAGRITASHADLLVRMDAAAQNKILERDLFGYDGEQDALSVRGLKQRIEANGADLKRAPWKLGDTRVQPVCQGCEFNTATDGGDAKAPKCLNRECFDSKLQQLVQLDVEALERTTGKTAVKVGPQYSQLKKGMLTADKVKSAKPKSCEYVIPAVDVDYNDKPEKARLICSNPKCKVHFLAQSVSSGTSATQSLSPEQQRSERELARETKIREAVVKQALADTGKLTAQHLRTLVLEQVENAYFDNEELFKEWTGIDVESTAKKSDPFSAQFAKLLIFLLVEGDIEPGQRSQLENNQTRFFETLKSAGIDGAGLYKRFAAELDSPLQPKPSKKDLSSENLNSLAPVKKAAAKKAAKKATPKKLTKKAAGKKGVR